MIITDFLLHTILVKKRKSILVCSYGGNLNFPFDRSSFCDRAWKLFWGIIKIISKFFKLVSINSKI